MIFLQKCANLVIKKECIMARVLISMSPEFLDKVDNLANSEQRTRSEYIREALRSYMRRSKSVNLLKAQQTANELEELIG